MTRDEVRRLIGGYATGSLTEVERKTLFEAALEDQDLFEELAHEQTLKEILEAPGAKQRLIAALAPAPRVWWRRPIAWAAIGAVAAGVVALSWVLERPSPPVQIAQVQSQPAATAPPVPPAVRDEEPKPAPAKKAAPAQSPATRQPAAPNREPADAIKEKDVETKKEPALERASAAPPPAPAARASTESRQSTVESLRKSAPRAQITQNAIGGVAGAPHLALDYALEDQDLVLKFAVEGYISIHFSPGLDTIVDSHVTAGSTRREPIPNNATEADIVFSAAPQSTSGGVSVVRENRAGTVSDPSGARIELLLKFYP